MGNIPAENPINHNVMKFQQIQNSMPQNSNMTRHINKDKYATAGFRTSTVVMMAEPTISGSSPNLNEEHMDKEMKVATNSTSGMGFSSKIKPKKNKNKKRYGPLNKKFQISVPRIDIPTKIEPDSENSMT